MVARGGQGDALPRPLGAARLGARDDQDAPARRSHLLSAARLGGRPRGAGVGGRGPGDRVGAAARGGGEEAVSVVSSPRKRGPIITVSGIWVPRISAFTRVFAALCAGTTACIHISMSSATSSCGAEWVIQPEEA